MKLHANVCSQWEWTKLRQLLVIVLLGLGIVSTYGQTKTVSGIVKSESGGEPLVGATVKVKETNTGGITDIDGRYTIQANLGQTLIVSYIGYRTKEVKVERTIRIDILLQEDNEMLDEVVVVGYGTMKRSDLTGSVVSVTGDELKKSVVTSLDQALQGRAAGVQVTQNSGTPGGGISVSIRGINSLNGNEPLYVIDGVAISGNNTSNSSVLSSINPADIVSMEVLKDASATAIYGSRASNGVVLITTRQGEEGKTKVSYEGYYALQQLPKKLETLTLPEYAVYQNLRAATIGFGAREEFKDPSLLSRGTDWQNEIFRTAPMHNHQINISGGSKSMKYSLSGGYMQQDGIVFGSDFERFSFRVNMDNDINKWLTTGLRASVARTQQTNNVDGSGAIYNALNQLPEVPARNPDGSFGMQTENMYGTYFSNPLSDLIQNENYSRNTQVYVNAFADIKLWKRLVFRTEYAANFNYSNDYKFTPSYDYEHFKQQSSASRGAGNGSNWTLKTYFTYNNTFGKHGLSAMLGHEAQENKYESLSGSRTNFLFNSVHELDAGDATTAKANSSRGSSAIESYFGRLNYNYNDRYLLTATLRADGNFLLDETGNRIQVAIPKDQTIGKSGIWVGDYIYEDRDNNGVIDEKDRTFLGNPAPKFTFGFNNYLSYKGFDLNIFLNGSVGNKAINLIRRTFTDPMRNSNLLKEATGIAQIAMHDPEVGDEVLSNVYVANADAAKVQRITTSSANDNNRISDRFVEDASYLRIKNISLGYTFPQKWLRRLQIDHLRLYVNIQNLCTITGYKGYDPEIGALNYNVLLRGVDDARYPSQRIYTFGLNFNF